SSGLFQVAANAAVQLDGGRFTFLPSHFAQGAGYFGTTFGGPRTLSGTVGGRFDWGQGGFSGELTIATNGMLNISVDNEKFFNDGATITNYGLITWSGVGAVSAYDDAFTPGSPIVVNEAGGVFEIQNDTAFQVPSWVLFYN